MLYLQLEISHMQNMYLMELENTADHGLIYLIPCQDQELGRFFL